MYITSTVSIRCVAVLSWVVALWGCGPRAALPSLDALRAEQPTLSALLWWVPPAVQTVSVAGGPFQVPALDAQPAPSLATINQAASLTLLRNLDGGRFFAGWSQATLTLGLDLRAAPDPETDAQPSAQILLFAEPISDRDWLSLEGAAADATMIEGVVAQRHAPQVRGRSWPIWLARPSPYVLILTDSLPLLEAMLSRRLDPSAPRALDPSHPAWADLPLDTQSAAWSLHMSPNLTAWAVAAPTPAPSGAEAAAAAAAAAVIVRCDPAEACAPGPWALRGDAEVLTLLRTLGYWVSL